MAYRKGPEQGQGQIVKGDSTHAERARRNFLVPQSTEEIRISSPGGDPNRDKEITIVGILGIIDGDLSQNTQTLDELRIEPID